MKKLYCFILFLAGAGVMLSYAQNPIPSFNVPVYHVANFQEQSRKCLTEQHGRAQRTMVVDTKGSHSSITIVYVYSLDKQDIFGPYTMVGEETLFVDIDSREWGVLVESEDHVTVDVWIEDE